MSEPANTLQHNDKRLAEWAGEITAAQWAKPSLCTEWTNHEVLAHLVVGYGVALSTLAASIVRQRGSFDGANTELARRLAAQRNPGQLIEDFVVLTRRPRGIGRAFPKRLLLGDHIIHELDISYSLGKESAVPVPVLVQVLNTQVRLPNPFVPAAGRARGLNLIATDAAWSRESAGPAVVGQAAHLASVLAGRPWALRHLSGDGVAVLSNRM